MKICRACLQDTKDKDIAYHYANKNYCRCKACTRIMWAKNNEKHKQTGVTMASTEKWTLGEVYSTKGMNKRDTMAVFMSAIIDCETEAEQIRYEREREAL